MEREQLKAIVENLLLASDIPVSPDDLQRTVSNATEKAEWRSILEELQEEYQARNLQVNEVAEGFQLCTRHEYSEWIRKFLKIDKSTKLSQPSLDTLSIIAYKQPLTRQEVEDIRGVDSSGVIKTLLEKKIIGPAGRKKVPGRPIMYRTTRKFLEYFGLRDLGDLPTLEDFKEDLAGELEGAAQEEIGFAEAETENGASGEPDENAREGMTESESAPVEVALETGGEDADALADVEEPDRTG